MLFIVAIVLLLFFLFIGSVICMRQNQHEHLFDGLKDFLYELAILLGCRPALDYRLYLSMPEAETWVDGLSSYFSLAYLLTYRPLEERGVLVLSIDFDGETSLMKSKRLQEKKMSVAKSLSAFYRKSRNVPVSWRIFFFQSYVDGYIEIWIPLNQRGNNLLNRMRRRRRTRKANS